jgi:hypothetical protein
MITSFKHSRLSRRKVNHNPKNVYYCVWWGKNNRALVERTSLVQQNVNFNRKKFMIVSVAG